MHSIVWAGDIPPSQLFGWTTVSAEPLWNGRHFHCGIDLPMKVGTQLFAARAGKVTRIGSGFLAVEVGDDEVDWYIHIDVALVAINSNVSRGQLIARSGNKSAGGTVIGAGHLHFETQHAAHAYSGHGGSSTVNNVGQAGNLNYPPTALDPVLALRSLFGGGGGELTGDDMPTAQELVDAIKADPELGKLVNVPGGVSSIFQIVQNLPGGVKSTFDEVEAVKASLADLKAAIGNLKIVGGGLTPEQDAHLASAEAAATLIEKQLVAGLKLDIPLGSLEITGTVKA